MNLSTLYKKILNINVILKRINRSSMYEKSIKWTELSL